MSVIHCAFTARLLGPGTALGEVQGAATCPDRQAAGLGEEAGQD